MTVIEIRVRDRVVYPSGSSILIQGIELGRRRGKEQDEICLKTESSPYYDRYWAAPEAEIPPTFKIVRDGVQIWPAGGGAG